MWQIQQDKFIKFKCEKSDIIYNLVFFFMCFWFWGFLTSQVVLLQTTSLFQLRETPKISTLVFFLNYFIPFLIESPCLSLYLKYLQNMLCKTYKYIYKYMFRYSEHLLINLNITHKHYQSGKYFIFITVKEVVVRGI